MHVMAFALVALGMVLTPGPNMIYLVSRTVSQGRAAGYLSLLGVFAGFLIYMLLAVFGITAMLMAVPFAYDALRIGGALYLLYLAWQAIRPGGKAVFDVRQLPRDNGITLVSMGFLTNLLNPKAAVLYLSLLPQFIDPKAGHVLAQLLTLGVVQISVSMAVNSLIIFGAGWVAAFLVSRPTWIKAQRWLMATVLGGLAVRLLAEGRR
ncbi:MAG: LysE family translocator [Asticcacaulis sp.]|nr:LysE family translocator [Asticcacaulis sp.]